MEVKVTKTEGYKTSLEMKITAEEFEKGIDEAYNKTKSHYTVQGFRKGKAPRYMIERVYGPVIFYEEAINTLFPKHYDKAIDEIGIYPVDQPSIDIKEIDPEKGVVIDIEVDVKPEVELGEYKGIEIEKITAEVTDDEVEQAIEAEAKKNSRTINIDDRPAKQDDTVVIDFEGFVNEQAFEGGKAEGHQLKIGSGEFIPGFEEQIVGKEIGEEFDVNVKFPEDYGSEDLKGKDAVFKVTLHEIKQTEIPTIDDEFAKDISEFDTIAEYKDDLREKLLEQKQTEAENRMKDQAVKVAMDNAKLDIPPAMIERRIDGQMRDFEMQIRYQGMELDQYLQILGKDRDSFREQFSESSKGQVIAQLVIEAISEKEQVQATEQEIEIKMEEMAKNYGMSVEDLKKNMNDESTEYIKDGVIYEKTVDLIYENAKKKKPSKKAKKEDEVKKDKKTENK